MVVRIINCSKPSSKEFGWYKMQVGKYFSVCIAQPHHKVPVKINWGTIYVVKSANEKQNGKIILRCDIVRSNGTRSEKVDAPKK